MDFSCTRRHWRTWRYFARRASNTYAPVQSKVVCRQGCSDQFFGCNKDLRTKRYITKKKFNIQKKINFYNSYENYFYDFYKNMQNFYLQKSGKMYTPHSEKEGRWVRGGPASIAKFQCFSILLLHDALCHAFQV